MSSGQKLDSTGTLHMANLIVLCHHVVPLHGLVNVLQLIENSVPSAYKPSAILIQLLPTFIAFKVLLLKASLQKHPREKEANHVILRPHYALEKDVACPALYFFTAKN